MNPRERSLAVIVLSVVILAVAGFLFKWLFLDSLGRINADINAAKADIAKKEDEKQKAMDEENKLLREDPRVAEWKVMSLPEDNHLAEEVKNGWSVEEAKKRHDDNVQGLYQRFLYNLVVKSGFSPSSIKVSPASADRKGGPMLSGKTPAYTRMAFTVQAQGRLDSVERMLGDFYKAPLLHQVRNLTLTARTPTRTTAPGGNGRFAGAAPGGAARFPGAAPGGARFPGAAQGGFPGAPAAFPGRPAGGAASAASSGDLEVSMTVEALLVTGAQKRDELLPKSSDLTGVRTLARGTDGDSTGPNYSDMLAKNMFTGISAKSQLTEDRDNVLSAVRLTSIWNNGRYWQATIYDQGKGGDEMTLRFRRTTPVVDEFSVVDSYGNVVVRGKAVKLDADGLIFEADGKYYRWRCGEYLGRRLASANASDAGDGSPQYIAGVLDKDNALKPDEVKALGISEPRP